MTRHRGQKYLCEFIHNLSFSKITSYNTFTTLLLGLRLSASFTWLLTKYVQLVCQTNHISIYSQNCFAIYDVLFTCLTYGSFYNSPTNTRLSIDSVQLPLWNIELPHFRPTCYRFQNSSWSIGLPNPNILWATLSSSTCKTMADGTGKSAQEYIEGYSQAL